MKSFQWNQVDNFIRRRTGNEVLPLKERDDVERMINYMLMKGNLVGNSDSEFMIPTGNNLKMNIKKILENKTQV